MYSALLFIGSSFVQHFFNWYYSIYDKEGMEGMHLGFLNCFKYDVFSVQAGYNVTGKKA